MVALKSSTKSYLLGQDCRNKRKKQDQLIRVFQNRQWLGIFRKRYIEKLLVGHRSKLFRNLDHQLEPILDNYFRIQIFATCQIQYGLFWHNLELSQDIFFEEF